MGGKTEMFLKFISRKIKCLKDEFLFIVNKHKYQFRPVFIIGCGRSGTTILGETLSKHQDICFLNERRDLWHKAYPEFDIWSSNIANPKLYVNKKNHVPKQTKILRYLFFKEQVLNKSSILLEKLPINSFRVEFLTKAFPEGKFIYLHRNGLQVCNSIQKAIKQNNWYGKNKTKYALLKKYASKKNLDLVSSIHGNREQAMLEWRLSIEASDKSFKSISKELYIDLSYYDFTNEFMTSIKSLLDFLSITYTYEQIYLWSKNIYSNETDCGEIDGSLKTIGGPLLPISVNNTYLKN